METLYITDLDGTLLNDKAALSEKSSQILKRLIENGVNFTLATARTYATVTEMFRDVPLKLPMVLMNGVTIYDPIKRKTIKSHCIDYDSAVRILEIYKKYNKSPLLYFDMGDCLEIKYSVLENDLQRAYVKQRTDVQGKKFTYSPAVSITENDKLVYIVTLDTYENAYELYNEIKAVDSVTSVFYRDNYSDCYFLEIFAKSVSKASGAKDIMEMLSYDRMIAFGDNLNDLPMFEIADECYAVSNACDELKEASTGVIGSNNEDAVAEFILKRETDK